MPVSVLTLVRGRKQHLANLMLSLARQTLLPDELVIAWMQPEAFEDLPVLPFPVRHVFVEGEELPLAKARNAAALAAMGDCLVFLDVDCIASNLMVASYAQAATARDGIFLSEVFYLPADMPPFTGNCAVLDEIGRPHVSKPKFPDDGIEEEPDGGQLWGLSFALRKETWHRIGGMDERFFGYGGEETDFAANAAGVGVRTYRVGQARVYHQHHPVSIPPLHHFASILRNAQQFRHKHGRWCMDYWLGQFRDSGLIRWDPANDALEILRHPEPAEIEAAQQPGNVIYS
ncbi:glycosyltransferase family 2 protein [Neorhizobium sp. NPDC001467]|uniref:glycosyltransferase family 2 protein n=1 Tax=Neorhizobium sp. NPDC001467 TaxID=3390595 RepID=UPI003D076FA2